MPRYFAASQTRMLRRRSGCVLLALFFILGRRFDNTSPSIVFSARREEPRANLRHLRLAGFDGICKRAEARHLFGGLVTNFFRIRISVITVLLRLLQHLVGMLFDEFCQVLGYPLLHRLSLCRFIRLAFDRTSYFGKLPLESVRLVPFYDRPNSLRITHVQSPRY